MVCSFVPGVFLMEEKEQGDLILGFIDPSHCETMLIAYIEDAGTIQGPFFY